jgi:protein-disulfide isomerase
VHLQAAALRIPGGSANKGVDGLIPCAAAPGIEGVDATAFQKCIDSGMSVGLVLKDMNAAQSNQIQGTPTIFINGHRVQGVESASKLLEMIAEARKETVPLRRTGQSGGR